MRRTLPVNATVALLIFVGVMPLNAQESQQQRPRRQLESKPTTEHPEVIDAQTPSAEPNRTEIKIFALQQIRADEARKVIADIFPTGPRPDPRNTLRIAVDPRTNSLVASGHRDDLDKIEALVTKLDVPADSQKSKKLVLAAQLRNISATEALAATQQLELADTKIHADPVRNMLIGTGPAEELSRAIEFVNRLDNDSSASQAQDLHIRALWLVDSSLADKDAAPVPADLNSAIAKLAKRVGLGELRTAAQFVVKVQSSPSSTFNAAGTAQLLNPCKVNFQGVLRMDDQGKCHLEVQASAHGEGDFETSKLSSVQTYIKTTPGHPVILGLTPINSKPSLFIVEIIQSELEDDVKAEKQHDAK